MVSEIISVEQIEKCNIPFLSQINSSLNEQWKLLLEQKSIGYIFPGDNVKHKAAQLKKSAAAAAAASAVTSSSAADDSGGSSGASSLTSKQSNVATSSGSDDDWQIVFPLKSIKDENSDRTTLVHASSTTTTEESSLDTDDMDGDKKATLDDGNASTAGILPAARARLVSLRELGAKKIGALKMKLAENKMKSSDKGF